MTRTTGVATRAAVAGADAAPTSSRSSSWCGRWSWPKKSRATPCGWWTRRGRGGRAITPFIREWVKWGAGLRASQALILAGKARALLHGRYHVSVADIQALARPVLRHRIIPNFYAESERVTRRQHRRAAARGGAGAAQRNVADGLASTVARLAGSSIPP